MISGKIKYMSQNNLTFIPYCRKSSEAEDRQMLSIDSQKKALGDIVDREHLSVPSPVLFESKSAYTVGREEFNKMIALIETGKANSILTYHLTRLARNSLDGGKIVYLMDHGIIKAIRTPEKLWTNTTDDKFMMQIHFAMAKKSSDDTSDFVLRDIQAKLRKGEYPDFAPIGYLNIDKDGKIAGKQYILEKQGLLEKSTQHLKRIEPDPILAPMISKLYELNATGQYTLVNLCKTSFGWGLHGTRSKTMLSKATMERILKNPFYYGAIRWMGVILDPEELPDEFRHSPIISRELFRRNQEVLGSFSHPVGAATFYPYSNFIRCDLCQGIISGMTAKGSSYYRCVRCKGIGYTREDVIEKQILSEIGKLAIDEDFLRLTIEELNKANVQETGLYDAVRLQQDRTLQNCDIQLDNLLKLKISPTNADGSLMNDEAYAKKQKELLAERKLLQQKRADTEQGKLQWHNKCVEYFNFTCNLQTKYPALSPQKKREVFQFFYYNPVLKQKLVLNTDKKRYQFIIDLKNEITLTTTANSSLGKTKTAYADAVCSVMRVGRDSNPQPLP